MATKRYKVYEDDAKHFTRSRDVLFHDKFHTFKEVTKTTPFYKDSVIDDTQPDDVKDELEIPATATESSEDVPPVGATCKSQEVCGKKWEMASRLRSSISSTQLSSTQPQLHGTCLLPGHGIWNWTLFTHGTP